MVKKAAAPDAGAWAEVKDKRTLLERQAKLSSQVRSGRPYVVRTALRAPKHTSTHAQVDRSLQNFRLRLSGADG